MLHVKRPLFVINQLSTDFYPIYILDSLKREVVQEHQTISLDRQKNQEVHRTLTE